MSGMDLAGYGRYGSSNGFHAEEVVTPRSSLKLGDRVLLITRGVGREGEVVAVSPSGLARVALSDGTLKALPVDANPGGTCFGWTRANCGSKIRTSSREATQAEMSRDSQAFGIPATTPCRRVFYRAIRSAVAGQSGEWGGAASSQH